MTPYILINLDLPSNAVRVHENRKQLFPHIPFLLSETETAARHITKRPQTADSSVLKILP